jgi:DNA-binding NtrC family response regulator
MTLHDGGQSLADVERDHILGTLAHCGGNRTRAARVLKISVRSLRMKLQTYAHTGISVPAPGHSDQKIGL